MDGKDHRSSFSKYDRKRATQLLENHFVEQNTSLNLLMTNQDLRIYILKNKENVYKKFIEWNTMVENSRGQKIKTH